MVDIHGSNGNDKLNGGAGNDKLYGYDGNDQLYGEEGNDYLSAHAGKDRLFGGNGNDILWGDDPWSDSGADDFIFENNSFGNDVIKDFDNSDDQIVLSSIASITDHNDLFQNHLSQSGSDVIVDAGGGNTILIEDILLS